MLRAWLCVLFCLLLSADAIKDINVCLSLTSTQSGTVRARIGLDARNGLLFLSDWLDGRGGFRVANESYRFNFKIEEDNGDSQIMLSKYRDFVNSSTCNFLIGPAQSDFNIMAAAQVTEPNNRLLLAHNAAADEFFAGRNKAFSIMPPASRYLETAFGEARFKGAKTISVIMSDHPVHVASCSAIEPTLAPNHGMTVASFRTIKDSSSVEDLTPERIANLTAAADEVIATGADGVMVCSFAINTIWMVDYWKSKQYSPKIIVINVFGTQEYTNWTNSAFVTGVESWDASARYPADKYFGTMENLLKLWKAKYPSQTTIGFAAMNALYTGVSLMESIQQAKSLDEDLVTFSLSRLDLSTLRGRIAWAGDRTQLGSAVFMQMINSSIKTVGPVSARTIELLYPFPAWKERIYDPMPIALPAEKAIAVVFAAGIFFNVMCFGGLLKYWTNPVVLASSPVFLTAILAGTTILMCSMWVWMPSLVSVASCHLRFWLMVVGFGITFGSLFAKTWRVWTLFSNSKTSSIKITDKQLGLVVFVVVGIEIILTILVSSVGAPSVAILIRDPYRPALNEPICAASQAQVVLTIILAVYNGIIVLYGIYLAFRVRIIPISKFNESKIIGFSIYNASFFCIIMGVIQASDATNRVTLFVLLSVAVFFGCIGTVAPLFISKYNLIQLLGRESSGTSSSFHSSKVGSIAPYSLRSGGTDMSTRRTSMNIPPSESMHHSDGSVSISQEEFDEYKALKKRYRKLERKNQKLEFRLMEANNKLADLQGSQQSSSFKK